MLQRGSDNMNMKEAAMAAFRKFVSLIPENVKGRQKPVTERITEAMNE